MNKSKITQGVILTLVVLFSIILVYNRIRSINVRPNIILITLDALRPDHLGCYGYERNTSPNIDRLARRGVVFENAIAQGSFTPPAMTAILYSAYPPRLGVESFGSQITGRFLSLSGVLKKYGRKTAFFSSHIGMHTVAGFSEQFDTFNTRWTYPGKIIDEETGTRDLRKGREITEEITGWISENKNRKFFLWVHYIEPHWPMNPPAPYSDMFAGDELSRRQRKVPVSGNYELGFGGIPRRLAIAHNYNDNFAYYLNLYDGSIRYADDEIGKLIAFLEDRGLFSRTIFIISADHGESLGERGQFFTHGFHLYDELIRVPLIISAQFYKPKMRRIKTQVRHIDIAPTMLEMLGFKKSITMRGESLVGLMDGKNVFIPPAVSFYTDRIASLRTNKWKFIVNYGDKQKGLELYNLRIDPKEEQNLAEKYPRKAKFLAEKLQKLRNVFTEEKKSTVQLSEQDKEILKSLGYLQ